MPALPDVTEKFVAETSEYVSKLTAAIEVTKAFADECHAATAAVLELQSAISHLEGKTVYVDVVTNGTGDMGAATGAVHSTGPAMAATAAETAYGEATRDTTAAIVEQAAAVGALDVAFSRFVEPVTGAVQDIRVLGGVSEISAGSLTRINAAMVNVGNASRRLYTDVGASTSSVAAMGKASLMAAGQINAVNRSLDAMVPATLAAAEADRIATAAEADEAKVVAAYAAVSALATENKKASAAADVFQAATAVTASNALRGVITSVQSAGAATRVFGLTMSALHWIAGVTFEALAVLIPAIIAFGMGGLVAAQGAMNASNHMNALWTAAEATNAAFHQTMGTLLGLKPTLQAAQDAANPGVYEMLGSAVNDVKAQFGGLAGSGLQVVHVLDEFSARITVDLKNSGGQIHTLLGNMVADLVMIGQTFGNVGHAILNFAADMPGLAEVLLMVVDGISKVILWISQLPPWIITTFMAFEEFYRWGGLVASIISRVGLALAALGPAIAGAPLVLFGRLAAIMGSLVGVGAQLVGGLASVAGGVAKVIPAAGGAATALGKLSTGLAAAASNTAMMGGIGLAIAAVIGLGVAFDHVRNSTQQFIDSTNKAVKSASDMTVLNVVAAGLIGTSQRIAEQEAVLHSYPGYVQAAGGALGGFVTGLQHIAPPIGGAVQGLMNLTASTSIWGRATKTAVGALPIIGPLLATLGSGAGMAASKVDQLKVEQMSLVGTFKTVTGNMSYLAATYHTTGVGAAALAQEAGVNLQVSLKGSGAAAQIARQQIMNLEQGLGAMGAPAGVVGADMEALGIQSQLAATKVSQVNSALDQFLSTATSGMGTFSQLQTAIGSMATDAAAKSANLKGAIGSVAQAGGQMSYTLKGLGAAAMQSWQQLTGALNTGEQSLNFMRTGMAEGMVSQQAYKSSVQAVVGEMVPYTAGNKAATAMLSILAQQAGGPATTSVKALGQWAGVTGSAAANQLANGIENATIKMSNMSQVAQNLSAVVTNQLDASMAAAIAKTEGISGKTQTYITDLARLGAGDQHTKDAQNALNTALNNAQRVAGQVAGATAGAGNAIGGMGNKAATASGQMSGMARTAAILSGNLYAIPNVTRYVSIVYTQSGAAANAQPLIHPAGKPYGFQHGGVLAGFSPGQDTIPAMLSGGESILNPWATRMVGAGAVNWLNTTAEHGGGSNPSALRGGGGIGGGEPAEIHSHLYLDGKEIFTAVQRQDLRYSTRNSGQRTGRMTP